MSTTATQPKKISDIIPGAFMEIRRASFINYHMIKYRVIKYLYHFQEVEIIDPRLEKETLVVHSVSLTGPGIPNDHPVAQLSF